LAVAHLLLEIYPQNALEALSILAFLKPDLPRLFPLTLLLQFTLSAADFYLFFLFQNTFFMICFFCFVFFLHLHRTFSTMIVDSIRSLNIEHP
jgi:hypothetical protein